MITNAKAERVHFELSYATHMKIIELTPEDDGSHTLKTNGNDLVKVFQTQPAGDGRHVYADPAIQQAWLGWQLAARNPYKVET